MTRVLLLLLVLLTTSLATAQEFKLEIKGNNPTNPGPEMQLVTSVFLGYDPIALDHLEWQDRNWIERRSYPVIGEVPLFEQAALENDRGRDLAFRDPGVVNINDTAWQSVFRADLSKMDIRYKPATDSFMLKWVLFVDPTNEEASPDDKMTLSWDRNQIPSIVKHLILAYRNSEKIIDMKDVSSVVIWGDSLQSRGSQNLLVTLYYNMDIPAGNMSVDDRASTISMRAYPNPAISHSKILLELQQTEYVSLAIYDVQGREVMTHSFMGMMGMNEISIDRDQLGLSSGVYFVRAMIGTGSDQVLKTTSIRLQ
jgi:hypothetical protein